MYVTMIGYFKFKMKKNYKGNASNSCYGYSSSFPYNERTSKIA
jgi:hypothetical protein